MYMHINTMKKVLIWDQRIFIKILFSLILMSYFLVRICSKWACFVYRIIQRTHLKPYTSVYLNAVDLFQLTFISDLSWDKLVILKLSELVFRTEKIWLMRAYWSSTPSSGKTTGSQAKCWMGSVPTSIDIGFAASVTKDEKESMKSTP